MKPAPDFEALFAHEFRFFVSEGMREAFLEAAVEPYVVLEKWSYGGAGREHECWVVAEDATQQIVYCATGFGPDFSWSVQPRGASNLGMDGEWHAYLVESFVCSGMWAGEVPEDFELKGPGERGSAGI